MALHRVDHGRSQPFSDVYSRQLSQEPLPKYRMPHRSSAPATVHALVRDELALDGNSAQNLATFCTTWAEPEVHALMDECLDKNMIDKDEYPQTAEIESRCVHMIADLWHSPAGRDTAGCSTTGSSEAAMLAGLALKWRWRKRREAEGEPADRPNLVCGPVQVCWEKLFCRDTSIQRSGARRAAVGAGVRVPPRAVQPETAPLRREPYGSAVKAGSAPQARLPCNLSRREIGDAWPFTAVDQLPPTHHGRS